MFSALALTICLLAAHALALCATAAHSVAVSQAEERPRLDVFAACDQFRITDIAHRHVRIYLVKHRRSQQ